MRAVVLASIALLAGGWPDRAAAQGMDHAPMPQIAGIFAEGNRARLCGPAGRTVRPLALLGELGRVYGVNFFALPDVDRLGERTVPDTVEARAVAWIIRIGAIRPEDAPLEANQYSGLNSMRWAFADYLQWASEPTEPRLYPAVRGPDFLEPPPLGTPLSASATEADARRQELLLAFFSPLLGIEPDRKLQLSCTPRVRIADANRPADTRPPPPAAGGPPASLAIRGQIDDLAARAGTDAFKKASSAQVAFTDNNEAGTTSLAINGVVGIGTNVGARNQLYGFVHYVRSNNETDDPSDDDDAKDIHSISPGIFFRTPLALGDIRGTLGLTAYATFDIENEAELVRARLLYSNVAIPLPWRGGGFLCGQEWRSLFLYVDCRINVFVEAAEVLQAGTNADLLEADDDRYLGAGADLSLLVSPVGPAFLRPLTLTLSYRGMEVFSGPLDDPQRLEMALTYSSPSSLANRQVYTFGISRVRGENFETFQPEDLWKVTVGLRF